MKKVLNIMALNWVYFVCVEILFHIGKKKDDRSSNLHK